MTETLSAAPGARVRSGAAVYNEIHDFLVDEAALLDQFRLQDWLGTLAPDVVYEAPVRVTRMRADKTSTVDRRSMHFEDSFGSLTGRVMRILGTKSAWAEDPISRTRRFVSNLVVHETPRADEFAVVSYLQLLRSRHEASDYETISCERRDVLRRTAEGWRLARREIVLDQSVLGMSNLAVFL